MLHEGSGCAPARLGRNLHGRRDGQAVIDVGAVGHGFCSFEGEKGRRLFLDDARLQYACYLITLAITSQTTPTPITWIASARSASDARSHASTRFIIGWTSRSAARAFSSSRTRAGGTLSSSHAWLSDGSNW